MNSLKVLTVLLLMQLSPLVATADWLHEEAAIMGTAISVELWHADADQGSALIHDVMDEMHRIDDLMSTYKSDSELSRVNAGAAVQPVTVSNELLALIERALEFSEITRGAFDITYASAGQYYDYRKGRKPDNKQLADVLPAVNYHHVRLNPEHSTVQFLQPGVRIDLGGIAKGHAVDRSITMLQAAGVRNALIGTIPGRLVSAIRATAMELYP